MTINISPQKFYCFVCKVLILVFTVFGYESAIAQKKIHTVMFEGTDHELHIYRNYGEQPGKTLLLIGGIQGDEPGGFLSADHYAEFSLSKGNLIVVPRANFQSILLRKRQINEDMNRKFADEDSDIYEAKIVDILKQLISESDCLLNLHDGSGFFSEKWEGENRNPNRYGQSIIADADVYNVESTGEQIHLGNMANTVINMINKDIKNPEHYFHFNNHRTREKNSTHKEQRKSATYYALTQCNIPAFGVETSKSLILELKVKHHNLAINAFMKILDIVPETPGINLDSPEMKYLVISVNDSIPVVVANNQTVYINPGDKVTILHIEANYERGLSADILGLGTINDLRRPIVIDTPVRVVTRKDYDPCGSIYIEFGRASNILSHISASKQNNYNALLYKAKINGKDYIAQNYQHINLIKGDKIAIIDIITCSYDPSELEVNFKGYVSNRSNNTGEDRGSCVDTSKDLLVRYSLNNKGNTYKIVTSYKGQTIGLLFIDLSPPIMNSIFFKDNHDRILGAENGKEIKLQKDSVINLFDIATNFEDKSDLNLFIVCQNSSVLVKKDKAIVFNDLFKIDKSSHKYRIDAKRGTLLIGSVFLNYVQEG